MKPNFFNMFMPGPGLPGPVDEEDDDYRDSDDY